jgi:hypothetical protein
MVQRHELRELVVLLLHQGLRAPGCRVIRRGFMERVGFSFMVPAASAFCFVELISAPLSTASDRALDKKQRVVFVACAYSLKIYWYMREGK